MISKIVNLNQLKQIACYLADNIKTGDVICLFGDLGVGKTQFSKFFIQNLTDQTTEVTSPTFSLVQIYHSNIGDIWHFDLYRIKNKDDIYEIGIEDAMMYGVSLIEWPQIAIDFLPRNRHEIYIEYLDDIHRKISITKGLLK